MDASSDFPFSVQTQKSLIKASLNAGMVLNLVMGVYTIVCGGTIYLYMSKRSANLNRRIILSAISLLYLLALGDFIIEWYYLNLAVVTNGDTRKSIFISTLEGGSPWIFILDDCFYYGVFLVSDMLLIWRCYQIWGMSLRMALIPLIFFLAECGLYVALIVTAAITGSVASDTDAIIANNIQSAEVFVSLATTMSTTALIAYKIYSSSRTAVSSVSKGAFNRIAIIIVESAAVYSLFLLVYAIMLVDPPFGKIGTSAYNGEYYVGPLMTVVAGLAPTVLVARIALAHAHGDQTIAPTVTHISGLQFHHQNDTAFDNELRGTGAPEDGHASTETRYLSVNDEEKMAQ